MSTTVQLLHADKTTGVYTPYFCTGVQFPLVAWCGQIRDLRLNLVAHFEGDLVDACIDATAIVALVNNCYASADKDPAGWLFEEEMLYDLFRGRMLEDDARHWGAEPDESVLPFFALSYRAILAAIERKKK